MVTLNGESNESVIIPFSSSYKCVHLPIYIHMYAANVYTAR